MKGIKYFSAISEFCECLEANHADARELQVGFYKKNLGQFYFSWSEAVDQAICFGLFDGVRNAVDEISYTVCFTPHRKPTSIWSVVSFKKVEELTTLGLMRPAGSAVFNRQTPAANRRILARSERRLYRNGLIISVRD